MSNSSLLAQSDRLNANKNYLNSLSSFINQSTTNLTAKIDLFYFLILFQYLNDHQMYIFKYFLLLFLFIVSVINFILNG